MAYCSMCGSPVPEGQSVCSMCYGDPYYGKDGYYLQWLEEQDRQAAEKAAADEAAWQAAMEEQERGEIC